MSAQKSKRHGRRRDKPYNAKQIKTAYRYGPPVKAVPVVRR
jgi:hypothetical protein